MRKKLILSNISIIILLSIFLSSHAQNIFQNDNQQVVTTSTGRRAILKADGNWQFIEEDINKPRQITIILFDEQKIIGRLVKIDDNEIRVEVSPPKVEVFPITKIKIYEINEEGKSTKYLPPPSDLVATIQKAAIYDRFTDFAVFERKLEPVKIIGQSPPNGLNLYTVLRFKGKSAQELWDFSLRVNFPNLQASIPTQNIDAYLLLDSQRQIIYSRYSNSPKRPNDTEIEIPLDSTNRGLISKAKKIELKVADVGIELTESQLRDVQDLIESVKQIQARIEASSKLNAQVESPKTDSSNSVKGKLITAPKPKYPKELRKKGVSGIVVVEITIDEKGNVTSAKGISGNPLLFPSAESAAYGAKFQPSTKYGKPVKVTGKIEYSFHVDN